MFNFHNPQAYKIKIILWNRLKSCNLLFDSSFVPFCKRCPIVKNTYRWKSQFTSNNQRFTVSHVNNCFSVMHCQKIMKRIAIANINAVAVGDQWSIRPTDYFSRWNSQYLPIVNSLNAKANDFYLWTLDRSIEQKGW